MSFDDYLSSIITDAKTVKVLINDMIGDLQGEDQYRLHAIKVLGDRILENARMLNNIKHTE